MADSGTAASLSGRRFLVSGINGKNGAIGFLSDHFPTPLKISIHGLTSKPETLIDHTCLPTGLYFLLPVMRINLQVLAGSGGMICSLVEPCLFGDTGIEPAELAFLYGFGSSALSRFVTRLLDKINSWANPTRLSLQQRCNSAATEQILTNKLDCPRDLFQFINKRLLKCDRHI